MLDDDDDDDDVDDDDEVAVVVMIADDDDARGTEARCHASASEMNTGAETFDTNPEK